jgi:hypothetical protein
MAREKCKGVLHLIKYALWVPEQIWTQWLRERESPFPLGLEPRLAGYPPVSLFAMPTDVAGSQGGDCHIILVVDSYFF